MMRVIVFMFLLLSVFIVAWSDPVPTTLNDFFMPGSQPNESGDIQTSSGCGCHAKYDKAVEPMFTWEGSMMAQAGRDPLFLACLTIANQDAPEAGDLCIRCHFPRGWLGGRSTPTDGSALTKDDRDGVDCHFCHKMIKPTEIGVNPYPGDTDYQAGAYPADQSYIGAMSDTTSISADGMFIVDSVDFRRGPYVETVAPHDFYYSPFHRDASMCGTCHDVSNPVYVKDAQGKYVPGPLDAPATDFSPYQMFPIERTYSEWLHSAYNTAEGIYAPQFGGNVDTVRTCQDCHLHDVTGKACKSGGASVRNDLGVHDLTGGNTFIPKLIDLFFPGDNVDTEALDSSIVRARAMLQKAASLDVAAIAQGNQYLATVTVTNETGHKLPSGYPEGRRIWLNVRCYNTNDSLLYESGAYDTATAVLTHDADAKIYEIKPGLSNTIAPVVNYPAGPSFHFAVNDTIYTDNRIPPRGFTNAAFEAIQSPPINYSYADGQYWDDTEYLIPGNTEKLVVTLFYQTTSKEYVEFLRDENVTNDYGDTLFSLWSTNGKSVPEVMQSDTVLLTPMTGNQTPILDDIGLQDTDENTLLEFTVTASDPDGTTPTLTAEDLPTGASFDDNHDGTGLFSWMPNYDQAGAYDVIFKATDDSGAVDSEVVPITVNNVNRPPAIDPQADTTIDETQPLLILLYASDPDGESVTFSHTTLPAGANFVDSGNGVASLAWTPTYDQAGSYPITFIVNDPSAAADSEVVTIAVNNVNRPPTIDPQADTTVYEEQPLLILLYGSDPDGEAVTFSHTTLPTGANFVDSGNGVASFDWTPTTDQAGEYPITFIVEDPSSAADSTGVTITVVNSNQPPTMDTIDPQATDENVLLQFTVTASDPDGTIPTLTADNMPSGATFDDNHDGSGSFNWTPTYDQAGEYPVLFVASDGLDADSQTVQITVNNVNRPPVFDALTDQAVYVDSLLTFDIFASDPDGQTPVLDTLQLPAGAIFSDNHDGSGSFSWTPTSDQVGLHDAVFTATDGVASDTTTVSIEVLAQTIQCGDANGDGEFNVGDAVFDINFVFKGGPAPDPLCSGDANGDGSCNVGDAVYVINYVFKGGDPPVDGCCGK